MNLLPWCRCKNECRDIVDHQRSQLLVQKPECQPSTSSTAEEHLHESIIMSTSHKPTQSRTVKIRRKKASYRSRSYKSPSTKERMEWIRQTQFVLSTELIRHLGRKSKIDIPNNYTGPLTLSQQAEIVQNMNNDDFLGKKKWKVTKFPRLATKSPRVGVQYQANIPLLEKI